eukprot:gene29124-32342_t
MAAFLAILLMSAVNPVAEVDSVEIDSVWFGSPPTPKASSKVRPRIYMIPITQCCNLACSRQRFRVLADGAHMATISADEKQMPVAEARVDARVDAPSLLPARIESAYSQPSTFPPISSPCSTPSNNVLGTSYTCYPSSIIEAAAHSPVSSFPSFHAAQANPGQLSDDNDTITIDCQRDQPPSPWVGNAYLFSRSGKAVDSCNGDVVLTAAEWEQIQRRQSEHEQCVLNFEQCQRDLETQR